MLHTKTHVVRLVRAVTKRTHSLIKPPTFAPPVVAVEAEWLSALVVVAGVTVELAAMVKSTIIGVKAWSGNVKPFAFCQFLMVTLCV